MTSAPEFDQPVINRTVKQTSGSDWLDDPPVAAYFAAAKRGATLQEMIRAACEAAVLPDGWHPTPAKVRADDHGDFDEFALAGAAGVHFEMMDAGCLWGRIDHASGSHVFWIKAAGKKLQVTVHED